MDAIFPDKAVIAAADAAERISGVRKWVEGEEPGASSIVDEAKPELFNELLQFIRDNPTAPAEATYIKAGALGFHDGRPFDKRSIEILVGYHVFVGVLLLATGAITKAESERRSMEAIERIKAPAPLDDQIRQASDSSLEGTPFERHVDPNAPIEGMAPPAATPAPEAEFVGIDLAAPAAAPAVAEEAPARKSRRVQSDAA